MSFSRYSISIHYARTFLSALERQGYDGETVLAQANLSRDLLHNEQVRITPHQLAALVQGLWRLGDDEFLHLTRRRSRFGTFALMASHALGGTSLRSVYHRSSHFYNLINESVRFQFEEREDRVRFSLELAAPELDRDHTLTEFLLMIWHRFPSWMIGRRIPLQRVCFSFSQPAHAAEYRLMYPAPVFHNQTFNGFEFDKEYLDSPVVQTIANLRSYLQRAPLDWFSRQAYYPTCTRRVLGLLEESESLGTATMDEIADAMHTTTRTLRRKLTEEETSFQEIKDSLRRDTAIHLLSQPNEPVASIARQLGFSEPSAFTRAFKHWTGVAPSAYRKQGED
ncbi:transcriptional regulator [Marinobacterium nitratireducens]|uniref:Transcriptional regulator n=1 Tax=Marinobacterium nitratireducens TaxID=518897 RepID=A0A917ZED6_9GAMM|nr:AraC family transcriptional regulator [Marinobacterium nitratireducens]GGO81460.1 transcriptional regulator [Marinobacterium nitratireducens]